MKPSFSPSYALGTIEPLESRIAPALIYIGLPVGGVSSDANKDTQYNTGTHANPDHRPTGFNSLLFTPTFASATQIAKAVNPGTGANDTYYLLLSPGDQVHVFNEATGYKDELIDVISGHAVAFFTDLNHDNRYEAGEFTGLALGKNASVQLGGAVNGDVVTDLNDSGGVASKFTIDIQKVGAKTTAGLVSNHQGITYLNEQAGSVLGDVLSGGTISKFNIQGNVNAILAGSAATGAHFDFFQTGVAKRFTINSTDSAVPAGATGASIANGTVQTIGSLTGPYVRGLIRAGNGGADGVGGSVDNVFVTGGGTAANAYSILAGNGGNGFGANVNGGAGGSVQDIYIGGALNSVTNSLITIEAGNGGNGLATAGGGAGGTASSVFIGYGRLNGLETASVNLSSNDFLVEAGAGGAGKAGGAGGALSNVLVRSSTPDSAGNEIALLGGNGGAANAAHRGHAGAGGSVDFVAVLDESAQNSSDILLQAGNGGLANGGAATGLAKGAAGGSISTATFLGYNLQVLAGNGSRGTNGGSGGSINGMKVLSGVNILDRQATFNPGYGGDGFAGIGGSGGSVSNITVPLGDFSSFVIGGGIQGNGGLSAAGIGGAGGSISGVSVQDVDSSPGSVASLTGSLSLRAGNGGNGVDGGGGGGFIGSSNVTGDVLSGEVVVSGYGLNMSVNGGNGGNAAAFGPGGKGGRIAYLNVTALDNFLLTNQNGVDVSATVTTGTGGHGNHHGKGGAGGNVLYVNAHADGNVAMIAGNGGKGLLAAPGVGGSIFFSGAFANNGSGAIEAGSAGTAGVGAAAGGSLEGNPAFLSNNANALIGLRAETSLSLVAGNGYGGGPGGDIVSAIYGSTSFSGSPSPSGNILVQAGNGSGSGSVAGRGGMIMNLSGSITSGPGDTTTIEAGVGGSAGHASGAGGSVTNVTILGGGAANAVFTVAAGDAGNSPAANVGGAGGNVNSVQVNDIDPGTIFRSVAAGNGGSAHGRGGAGGSIESISVAGHDIGIRDGVNFGYSQAGGLFAGVGGAGTNGGLNGSVSFVHANAIASIVAGRTLAPREVQSINHIFVNDTSKVLDQHSLVLPGAFTLTFGGKTTPLLPKGATTQDVQNALNGLSTVQATGQGGKNGTVTVEYGSNPGTYVILFTATGKRANIAGTEEVHATVTENVVGAAALVPVTEQIPGTQASAITIDQQGSFGLPTVVVVPGQAQFTTTTVVQGDVFQGVNAVQGLDLSSLLPYPGAVLSLSFGKSKTPFFAAALGAAVIENELNRLPSIAAAGGVTVAANPTAAGTYSITFDVAGPEADIAATLRLPQHEQFSLGVVAAAGNGTFQLAFKGQVTTALPSTASAAAVQVALNKLSMIKAAGGVTVAPAGSGLFTIAFVGNGAEPAISGTGFVSETQSADLTPLQSDPVAKVAFSFKGQTTGLLPVDATAPQIQAALNALSNVKAVGGVAVSATSAHGFGYHFGKTGAEPALVETAFVPEVEKLDVSGVDQVGTGYFALAFGGSSTPFLHGNATAAQIQAALDKLPSIKATGGKGSGAVTVTPIGNGTGEFTVTFNTVGEKPLLVSAARIFEQQTVEVYAPKGPAKGDFTLSYFGETTGLIPGGASASTVQADLNRLPDVRLAGGVTVSNGVNSIYTVTFDRPGPEFGGLLSGLQFEPFVTQNTVGSSTSVDIETISVTPKGAFDPVVYAVAGLVGSISNIAAIDANVFHYTAPSTGAKVETGRFIVGDSPIDGIVMAKSFDQSTVNFTPQAELIGNAFFDYLND